MKDMFTEAELERMAVALSDDWNGLIKTAEDVKGHSSEAYWREQARLAESAYLKVKALQGK